MALTPEQITNRKIWVDALRSNKFKQGKERLCTLEEEGQKAYCCLGVAKEVIPGLIARPEEYSYEEVYLDDDSAERLLGIDYYNQTDLAIQNDDGKPFSEIADYIENSL